MSYNYYRPKQAEPAPATRDQVPQPPACPFCASPLENKTLYCVDCGAELDEVTRLSIAAYRESLRKPAPQESRSKAGEYAEMYGMAINDARQAGDMVTLVINPEPSASDSLPKYTEGPAQYKRPKYAIPDLDRAFWKDYQTAVIESLLPLELGSEAFLEPAKPQPANTTKKKGSRT